MRGHNIEVIHHPLVYNPAPLIDFIHLITQHETAGATLIICASRQTFLVQLQNSVVGKCHALNQNEAIQEDHPPESMSRLVQHPADHPLFARTLNLLAISRRIRLFFCPSVAAFHAQIATMSAPSLSSERESAPHILAILNLIHMHRTTASYSAQGLGKAFAAGVEAAWRSKHRLIFFEYPESVMPAPMSLANDSSDPVDEPHTSDMEVDNNEELTNAATGPASAIAPENPWQEQVQILNATTKTFGNVGNRGWMGRTVRIADIAARWCTFAVLPGTGL